jgi:hypothetical protein
VHKRTELKSRYWDETDASILVWFRLEDLQYEETRWDWNNILNWYETDQLVRWDLEVSGLNIICEDFNETYPNFRVVADAFLPRWTTVDKDGQVTYEVYWNEEKQTAEIQVVNEIIAQPKVVNKFQPIGG